jgi:hypothetical protein
MEQRNLKARPQPETVEANNLPKIGSAPAPSSRTEWAGGEFFTSSGRAASQENLNASLKTIMDTIPLRQAEEVAEFAARLGSSTGGKKIATQTR